MCSIKCYTVTVTNQSRLFDFINQNTEKVRSVSTSPVVFRNRFKRVNEHENVKRLIDAKYVFWTVAVADMNKLSSFLIVCFKTRKLPTDSFQLFYWFQIKQSNVFQVSEYKFYE